MNATFTRVLLTALSIAALLLAGCGDDDEESNPTGPGTTSGGTSGGTGGVAGSINAGNVAAAQGALTTAFAKVMA